MKSTKERVGVIDTGLLTGNMLSNRDTCTYVDKDLLLARI